MIFGELNRPPLVMQIKQRMANFWTKLTKGKDSTLSVIMCRVLLKLNKNSEYESPWIKTVQNILCESGLSNVWRFPNVVNHKWLNNYLHDEYIQTWLSNVFHNDKCITNRIFKDAFEFESYLTLLPERLRIIFTQFSNTKLPIGGPFSKIADWRPILKNCLMEGHSPTLPIGGPFSKIAHWRAILQNCLLESHSPKLHIGGPFSKIV